MFGEDTAIFLDHLCRSDIISEACKKEFFKPDLLSFFYAKSECFYCISFATLRWAYTIFDITTNFLEFIEIDFVSEIESSENTIILHDEEECRWRSPF